jgi:hypothetical protein
MIIYSLIISTIITMVLSAILLMTLGKTEREIPRLSDYDAVGQFSKNSSFPHHLSKIS